MLRALIAFTLLNVKAENLTINHWGGINNSVDSAVIGDGEAQDSLNVELNKQGNGIRKRGGYVNFLTLSANASAVESINLFKNASGDECAIYASSGTIYTSINQATPVQITTITAGARLVCAANNGLGYCFSSANDIPFTDDCVTFSTQSANSYPRGRFSIFTDDRHVVAGSTSSTNLLFFSKAGDYLNFNTANTPNDAWTEAVGTAGDRITGLAYVNGRIIVFKEYSVIGFNCTDQFNCPAYNIATGIGIANHEAAVTVASRVYFKGSDNKFYATDGSPGSIQDISTSISSTTAALLTGKTRYSLQTEKTDWDAGNLTAAGPGSPMSTVITIGSVEPSSFTAVDTSSSDFASGTFSGLSTGAIQHTLSISSNPFRIINGDFEEGNLNNWTCATNSGSCTCGVGAANAVNGAYGAQLQATCGGLTNVRANVYILDSNNNVLQTRSYSSSTTILSGDTLELGNLSTQTLKIKFNANLAGGSDCDLVSTTFTAISSISWTAASGGNCPTGSFGWGKLDDIKVNRYFSQYQSSASLVFYSRTFNTSFSTPIGGPFNVTQTLPAGTTTAFQVRSASSASGVFNSWVNIGNGFRSTQTLQYQQYLSSFTTQVGTATPRLDDVSLVAATTGQYITRCIQPGSNITAWGLLEAAGNFSGGGSFQLANSTGTSCTDVGSTFTNTSTGTTISIATAAAYKVRVTFGLTSGSSTARLDSLTVNWTEGSVAPASYGTFWNDDIYWGVDDSGSTNNKTLKLDLLHGTWHVFNIPMAAAATFNNIMYFGCTTCGNVYKYGNIKYSQAPTSDDGTAIRAYFKTKDFSGANPFIENIYNQINLIATKQSGGVVSSTYTLNGGNNGTGTYDISLSTGDNVVRSNYSILGGQRAAFFNLTLGNNSVFPFEILDLQIDYDPQQWRPLP